MRFPSRLARKKLSGDQEKGVALVTTLLLLLLFTAMSVGMGLTVNSDMLMNGYYRNFRGAFYAADSGLAVARRDIYNQLAAAVPSTITSFTGGVIPAGTESTVASYMTSTYGSNTMLTGTGKGQAAGSWPGKFQITSASIGTPTCTVTGTTGTCLAPVGTPTAMVYKYPYSLTAQGQSTGQEATSISDSGILQVTVNISPQPNITQSFAGWGMFIDQYDICNGSYLVPGTISGPVFTNGAWTFGNSGNYVFTDSVGSVSSNIGYQDSACAQSSALHPSGFSVAYNGGNPNLGANAVPLPNNDFSQKRAVLDGLGANTAAVTNTDMNAVLRNASQVKYPTTGATTGVYLPYTVSGSTKTFTGGGIYVEGDASVVLAPGTGTSQVYTITQGTTVTTVTVNPTANTTTMTTGSNTVIVTGVPDSLTGGSPDPATMLYVDGNITSLSGPVGSAGATAGVAINDGQAITITAAQNVTITGDVRYKTEPVTLAQNGSIAADTLISGSDSGQTLGIFTATGDIQLNNAQNSNNLQIDASLATISTGGTGGLVNTGDAINTLTIVGGRIQNQIKNINATTRNVMFDRRYGQNGFAPPWFPSTTIINNSTYIPGAAAPIFQRTQWVTQNSYY